MSMDNNALDRGSLLTPRFIIGVAIALFGVVLVLDRLNLVIADTLLRWWPLVIIAIGALIFSQSRRTGSGTNGVIVMVIGVWLLLNSLDILRVRFWELVWPTILIGIGSVLVSQAMRRHTRESSSAAADSDATVNIFAVLSGVKRVSTSQRFRGGEVTAMLGGAHIDLRQATIPPGEEASLDVFAIMGGCEIKVPPSWAVVTPVVPVMGAVEDKRPVPLPDGAEALGGKAAPRLVLRGLVLMGGIEIKS